MSESNPNYEKINRTFYEARINMKVEIRRIFSSSDFLEILSKYLPVFTFFKTSPLCGAPDDFYIFIKICNKHVTKILS